MTDPLLSSLCSICNLKPHRYRCPRCSALTCSLPCIKRHKQWVQCNGVRDPSIYIKQKDLATPKGIDHDYNYLTSIEREIDRAEKNATSRGVVLGNEIQRKNQRNRSAALKEALERCGVIVARAPKGMSRSKQNATRYTKSRILRWTVEWVHPDGTKARGECTESQPISEAYAALLASQNPDRSSRKRKHEQEDSCLPPGTVEIPKSGLEALSVKHSIPTSTPKDTTIQDSADRNSQSGSLTVDEALLPSDAPQKTTAQKRRWRRKILSGRSNITAQVEVDTQQQLDEWRQELTREKTSEGLELDLNNDVKKYEKEIENGTIDHSRLSDHGVDQMEGTEEAEPRPDEIDDFALSASPRAVEQESHSTNMITLDEESTPKPELAFYLHHPSLPSVQPVLIRLAPNSTLATSLTNRLVLEFPTIYVLYHQSDNKLPDNLISEEDFFAMARKALIEDVEEGEVKATNVTETQNIGQGRIDQSEVDERRLREVLGQDLNGITRTL